MNETVLPIPESALISARLAHPCFPQPEQTEVKVWRYMTLAKLVSLIQKRSLFLSRLDQLADPYEGSTTKRTAAGIDAFFEQIGSKNRYETLGELYRKAREQTYVSCWHASENESEAMWKLYGGSGGIAIQTTYAKLVESITDEHNVYIGLVRYIDYDKASFPDANAFHPVMHKRTSFAHEHEVRLVWYWGSPPEPDKTPSHLTIPWNIESYCERVYVDPYAPDYYFEAVQAVLESMAPTLSNRLEWSKMKEQPFF